MPISVYSINVRGRDITGNHRCTSQEEAQGIYDQLCKAVNASEEFFEIILGQTKTTARKDNISGFSISVHMEETAEERKALAIQRIESDIGYNNTSYAEKATALGGGLIGGY